MDDKELHSAFSEKVLQYDISTEVINPFMTLVIEQFQHIKLA